jgi:hypothetical protein
MKRYNPVHVVVGSGILIAAGLFVLVGFVFLFFLFLYSRQPSCVCVCVCCRASRVACRVAQVMGLVWSALFSIVWDWIIFPVANFLTLYQHDQFFMGAFGMNTLKYVHHPPLLHHLLHARVCVHRLCASPSRCVRCGVQLPGSVHGLEDEEEDVAGQRRR